MTKKIAPFWLNARFSDILRIFWKSQCSEHTKFTLSRGISYLNSYLTDYLVKSAIILFRTFLDF